MKYKIISIALAVIMMASILAPVSASSSGEKNDIVIASASPATDFEYELIKEGTEVKIKRYIGPGGNVIVPSTIEGKPVKIIDAYCFGDLQNGGLYYDEPKSVVIPDGVTEIGQAAFKNCIGLESVVIPGSVTKVGINLFHQCSSLESVTLGEGFKTIANTMFAGCSSLAYIEMPSTVTMIAMNVFSSCSSLTTVVFNGNEPNTVLSWGFYVGNFNVYYYEGATGFETDSEGNWMEVPCRSIPPLSVEITSPSDDGVVYSSEVTMAWTSDNAEKTEISTDGVSWDEVTGTSHPLSLTDGPHTVYVRVTGEVGNTKVASVTFTVDTVTDVTPPTIADKSPTGDDVAIDSVISVTFSEEMDTDEVTITVSDVDGAISWEGNVATFTPSALAYGTEYTVTVNGKDIAGNALAETTWTFTTASASYDDFTYTDDGSDGIRITGYTGAGGKVVIPGTIEEKPVTRIEDGAFKDCTALTSIVIPDTVTSIGIGAFQGCSSLTSIVIPEGVTELMYQTFAGCSSLAYVEIPNSVTKIGSYVFQDCTALDSVTIPDAVTIIAIGAFQGCSSLTYIEIPASVAQIWNYVFSSCSSLTTVVFNGNAPLQMVQPLWALDSDELTVYYYEGATGFTVEEGMWKGVPCRSIPPLSVEITSPTADETLGTYDVTVTWTSDNAEKTEISTDGVNWDEVTGTSHELTLTDGPHTVYVRVTGEVGNTKVASVSFTTVDATAPTITDNSPTGDDVAIDSVISVTFSEEMDRDSVSIVVDGVDGTIAWNGNVATFTPSALAYGTEYTVTVNGKDIAGNELEEDIWTFTTLKDEGTISGIVKDKDGNTIEGATVTLSSEVSTTTGTDGSFSFDNVPSGSYDLTIEKSGYVKSSKEVTVDIGKNTDLGTIVLQLVDVTPPTITDKAPTGSDVAVNAKISIAFSEAMSKSSVVITVSGVTGTIAWNGNTAVFTPSSVLKGSTEYTVTVGGEDLAGNELAETTWTFTTADVTPPIITDKTPTGDDESTRTTINVTFSEAMNKTSVSIVINGVTGTIAWNGNTAVFTPSSVLKGSTEYTVKVNGKDVAGNALTEVSWTFTTADVATVSGMIKDKDGNPVAGATVTLTSTSTSSRTGMVPVFSMQSTVGRTLTTITDADGRYAFYDVSIGEYTVAAEKDGKKYTENVKVTAETIGSGTLAVDDVILSPKSGSDSTLLIIGVVAIVVLAALGAVFLVRRGSIKK